MKAMVYPVLVALAAVASLMLPSGAYSHELRPAYLQISEQAPQIFEVVWRVPARGQSKLSLRVQFDGDVSQLDSATGHLANGFYSERWRIRSPQQLSGVSVTVDGLEQTMTDVLVRVEWLDGKELVTRLVPERPEYTFTTETGAANWFSTYFALGLEHILLGLDHLLFVLVLLLLVNDWRSLIITISAFTLAHSITLALSVLQLVALPQAPVEAIIALSLVFVASEVLQKQRGRVTLAVRRPWLAAFGFGLLHGFGFAGALAEIGVPQQAVTGALLAFNLGVEAGQLVFIAAMAAIAIQGSRALKFFWRASADSEVQYMTRDTVPVATALIIAYSVGGLSSWWLIDRTVAFF